MGLFDRMVGLAEHKETSEDILKLVLDQEYTIFETPSTGYVGGLLNLAQIGGPNQLDIDIYLLMDDVEHPGNMNWFKYLHEKVEPNKEHHVEIWDLPEVYAPHGARVVVKQVNGVALTMGYYVYRR